MDDIYLWEQLKKKCDSFNWDYEVDYDGYHQRIKISPKGSPMWTFHDNIEQATSFFEGFLAGVRHQKGLSNEKESS